MLFAGFADCMNDVCLHAAIYCKDLQLFCHVMVQAGTQQTAHMTHVLLGLFFYMSSDVHHHQFAGLKDHLKDALSLHILTALLSTC